MKVLSGFLVACVIVASASSLFAHCEVPCGIYDDKLRLDMMAEHVSTIGKAIVQINELSAAGETNYNQIVRWTMTKESHATDIQQIVSQYFMTQRIKPSQDNYTEHLKMLHAILVAAMKTKQAADPATADALMGAINDFRASYLGPEGEAHQH